MNIEEAGYDDLVKELFNRCDHAIFCGLQKNYDAPNSSSLTPRAKGYPELCIGLAEQVKFAILTSSLKDATCFFSPHTNKDIQK